jgi:signal transduction histidine kinase
MDLPLMSYLKDCLSGLKGGPVWRGGAGDMVLTLYDDGVILDISPSAADIIGAAGPLTGRSLYDFVRREDRVGLRNILKLAAEGRDGHDPSKERFEFRLLRVRRAPALVEIVVKPLGRGRLTALICERREVLTQARKARQAVEQAGEQEGVAQIATAQTAAIAPPPDLVADLSHEMKTPLNAIMGFADAMRAETFGPLGDEKYKEYAEHIHASGAHLMGLIGSILDYAKLGADRYQIAPALADPGPVAQDCAAMIRGEAEAAGLTLTVEIAPGLPEILIDKQAVKQILINLLSNAVKFTAAGEVKLSVSEKCGALDFVVSDTGVGMSQVALAKLGVRFTDLHQNGVRGTKGAGLGLSLAFALAKQHGGALVFDSAQGEGTIARLTLPVRRSLDDASGISLSRPGDIQSQLDRVAQFRREHAEKANAA